MSKQMNCAVRRLIMPWPLPAVVTGERRPHLQMSDQQSNTGLRLDAALRTLQMLPTVTLAEVILTISAPAFLRQRHLQVLLRKVLV